LRVVFYVEGELVVTVDIGSHDLYCGESSLCLEMPLVEARAPAIRGTE
jgi:hypothetical protein